MTSTSASFAPSAGATPRGGLTASRVFAFDAITCVGMGLALTLATAPVAAASGLPPALLFWAGLVLCPSALAMGLAAWRPAGLWKALVVGGNLAWVVASIAVLVLATPNALGGAFVIAQAAFVAVLAWLEWRLQPQAA